MRLIIDFSIFLNSYKKVAYVLEFNTFIFFHKNLIFLRIYMKIKFIKLHNYETHEKNHFKKKSIVLTINTILYK